MTTKKSIEERKVDALERIADCLEWKVLGALTPTERNDFHDHRTTEHGAATLHEFLQKRERGV